MTDRQTRMPDLTVEWFRCAMQVRHQPDGAELRTLTPPRRQDRGIPLGIIMLAIIVLAVAAFAWGMIR